MSYLILATIVVGMALIGLGVLCYCAPVMDEPIEH